MRWVSPMLLGPLDTMVERAVPVLEEFSHQQSDEPELLEVQARAFAALSYLRQIPLEDEWARRRLMIGLRDANAVPRHVRVLIDHLCQAPGH